MDEREWSRLVEQIRNGDCTPFIGAGACAGTLPDETDLSRAWADLYEYPFPNDGLLADVMQYVSILEGDLVTVKRRLVQHLLSEGTPDFSNPSEPHVLLAQQPITTFLTTNYDDFMTQALLRAGKDPVTAICPWYADARDTPDLSLQPDVVPTTERPLVFHLHGHFKRPESLVLSEEDYLEFLVSLITERGRSNRDIIPYQVLPALTRRPLLFVGYHLRDLTVRFLFRALVQSVAGPHQRRHVSVQLTPPLAEDSDPREQQRAMAYLTKYLDRMNIAVYWGTTADFCAELAARLESS